MQALTWVVTGYLMGSMPFGLLIARFFCGIDPRTAGSFNVGSTNVARLCGKRYGFLTLFCDAAKGAIPVWLCRSGAGALHDLSGAAAALHLPPASLLASLVAIACIIGHSRSIFLGFKGGKAVATSVGVFLPLALWQLLLAGLVCVLIIWRSQFVSLGSLALVTLLPVLLLISGRVDLLPLALCIAAVVFMRHKDNISRLLKGEEKPWLNKKT